MKKKRAEAFFGMHFDFHAKPYQKNIGEFCDYETIDMLLSEVKPDYVQCDTKGHEGISSYPTNVGHRAPEMKGDILKMWRYLTEKHGVALYAHYSGVLDEEAVKREPDWAARDVDGNSYKRETSVFGSYVDELLIPQLTELATEWKLDGAWVDGDCWGAVEDYSSRAADAYKEKAGLDLPAADDEDGREKFREFCRDGFRDYVKHYCTEVHRRAPEFEIASNWMYTAYAPDRPFEGVDFISGDYSPSNSMRTAFFEGRAMQNSKKPWDLMAWGFNEDCTKEYVQLCAEASAVIALGGGFQVYNPQLVGSVQKRLIPMWKKLAKFCREREKTCHKAKPYHEAALLFSSRAMYAHKSNLFRWDAPTNEYGSNAHGLLFALLDAGYSTEILLSYQFEDMSDDELSEYAFIAVSDLDVIERNIKERLEKYVREGGNVLVAGTRSTALFERELGVKINGALKSENVYPFSRERQGVLRSDILDVKTTSAETIVKCNTVWCENSTEEKIFATKNRYGKGHFAGIYASYGEYRNHASAGARDALDDAVSSFYPVKTVEIFGTHNIQVVLTKKNDALNVNLINVSGRHTDSKYVNFDEITPIFNIRVSVLFEREPTSVIEMPSNKVIEFVYEDGEISFTLERLDIHTIIVIT